MKKISENYEVAVIGGGIAGICAAVASARHGAKTVLIHNRPVLGGNASSEIKMHICGADRHARRPDARETGILEEMLLKNRQRNNADSFYIFDTIMWETCRFQENLTLHLNTHIDKVNCTDNSISSVSGIILTSETYIDIYADLFVDATGDGTVGALAGAEFMYGREDKSVFNEPDAPDVSDSCTMGNTIMFTARDMGKPVPFVKPDWAYTYTEEDLKCRNHSALECGYWWVELGGTNMHTIYDAEQIRDELMKSIFGVWDHIKNGGDHGADNYELEWFNMLPGKRESRRFVGDYVLTENDLVNAVRFEDAVAYGGWAIDNHIVGGITAQSEQPTKYIELDDVYTIPYRSLVSRNIKNLFISGRAFSTSHLAFASTRVMATCGVAGQAIGTAAAICIKKGLLPKGLYRHIDELQQQLLKDDCYIPGVSNKDNDDMARTAEVFASSEKKGYEAVNVINGVSRKVFDKPNMYLSEGISEHGEFVELKFKKDIIVREVHLKFDSNLSKELTLSTSAWVMGREEKTLPSSLVKDYDIIYYKDGKEVYRNEQRNNIQRFNIIKSDNIVCNTIKVVCYSTYGDDMIRIFEVRVY